MFQGHVELVDVGEPVLFLGLDDALLQVVVDGVQAGCLVGGDTSTHTTRNPKPFIWTAKADDMLTKVHRGRVPLSKQSTKTETLH